MRDYHWFGLAGLLVFLALCIAGMVHSVKVESVKRTECEARGGEFVWPRGSQPLCLKSGTVMP